VTAVEGIETWAEEIEGRLDEVAAADRQMIVAVVSRSEKALRDLATALRQA